MKNADQVDSGLRKVLAVPRLYELCQNLVGAKSSGEWIAKRVLRWSGAEKVVDMGCGPGDIRKYLPADVDYWGFDISEDYIRRARRRFPTGATFLSGTARDFLDNPDNPLNVADLVFCIGLLHHLNDDEAIEVLELSKRIMKPGGRSVYLEPVFLLHQTRLSTWLMRRDRGRHVRSEQEWKDLMGRVFDSYSTSIVTGLSRIPWVHIVMESVDSGDGMSGCVGR